MGLASRLLVVAFAGVLALGSIARAAEPGKRPNIVYIMAVDLGWTDLACYGSKYYETPNLDKLAAQGMRFTDGYTCGPNCAPTRAALLTGQYGPRTGTYTVGGIDRFNWQTRPLRPVDNVQNLPREKVTVCVGYPNQRTAPRRNTSWSAKPFTVSTTLRSSSM